MLRVILIDILWCIGRQKFTILFQIIRKNKTKLKKNVINIHTKPDFDEILNYAFIVVIKK